jgi:hypothetical protein
MHDTRNGAGRVQELLPVADIDGDVVWLRGGGGRAALAVGSINFALAGEAEQEAVLAGYRGFLNRLRVPLQVLVRVEPTDVERYLGGLRTRVGISPTLARLALDHETFVRRLAREHTLLERRFYLVVPTGDDDPPLVPAPAIPLLRRRGGATPRHHAALTVRTLTERCDQVVQGLAGLGLAARRLSGRELAALWYAMLTPDRARRQPLPTTAGPVAVRTRPAAEEVAHVR